MPDITKKEMEQILNNYEYERSYKISTESLKEKIYKTRIFILDLLDDLEHEVDSIMDTSRCMKGGGVSLEKVWNLYANNPELSDHQSTIDFVKHLKNSKYPFEKILNILEKEDKNHDEKR